MPAFGSYQEAMASCGRGYAEDELVRVVVEKTGRYRDSLGNAPPLLENPLDAGFAAALGVAAQGGRLTCIDFGGAAGAHFFHARALLGRSVDLNWNVVESGSMAAAAAGMGTGGLRFFTDLGSAAAALREEGREVDLVFTNCALPYVPDPEGNLRELAGVGARRILVTRMPLPEHGLARRVRVQSSRLSANGPGPLPPGHADRALAYPVTFLDGADIERILSERYVIELGLREGHAAYYVDGVAVTMHGYLGRLSAP